MNRKRKIICLALLLVLFGGMYFLPMMIGTGQNVYNSEGINPQKPYQVAAAGDSALDAPGAVATNLTATNLHGDDMLAGAYETYTVVANASDADGFADIDYIWVQFLTSAGANISVITFTGATGLFTEEVGSSYIRLGSATNVSAANDVDITVPFKWEWAVGAITDMDINITVWDGAQGDTELLNLNLDIVATLTMSDTTLFTYAEYLNGEAFGTMGLTYHYTGYTTTYPLAAETDFYVSMAAIPSEQVGARIWESTAYDESTGIANFNNIIAPDVNTQVTATFTEYAVTQSGGSSGSSLAAATYTDTVLINPNAPPASERTPRGIIGDNFFGTPEGALLIGGAIVVSGGIVYYIVGRSSAPAPKKRRRKNTKRKGRKR